LKIGQRWPEDEMYKCTTYFFTDPKVQVTKWNTYFFGTIEY